MAVSAKDVMELRRQTDCGMMECKKALVKADGDINKAIEFLNGLLQVNDVDAVALGEDVLCHLGVPAAGLMTEMHAGFEKLFHRYDCHS